MTEEQQEELGEGTLLSHLVELRSVRLGSHEPRLSLADPGGGDQLHRTRDLHRRFDAADPAADLAKLSRSHWRLGLPDRSTVLALAHRLGVGLLGAARGAVGIGFYSEIVGREMTVSEVLAEVVREPVPFSFAPFSSNASGDPSRLSLRWKYRMNPFLSPHPALAVGRGYI